MALVWSIVVAGGAGTRFGDRKQFSLLGGRPVLEWAVEACRPSSAGVVLVVPADRRGADRHGADAVVAGGPTRADSVRCGLAAVPDDAEVIVVHDAARPLASPRLFAAVLAAVGADGVDGAVPGVPPSDTIKAVDGAGNVTSTLDRSTLVAVQTPQAFRAAVLRRAHARGGRRGHRRRHARRGARRHGAGRAGRARQPQDHRPRRPRRRRAPAGVGGGVSVRIGQGIDVHRFSEDPHRRLVLGGVEIEGARGLGGHSDADAVCHALADAVLGAVGLGDLGRHFPDTDPVWEGADSVALLTEVVAMAAAQGYACANADCTIVADAPRLAPHTAAMVERLSGVLGAPVSVKATRAEGLGALGRAEGIACLAVVLMEPR